MILLLLGNVVSAQVPEPAGLPRAGAERDEQEAAQTPQPRHHQVQPHQLGAGDRQVSHGHQSQRGTRSRDPLLTCYWRQHVPGAVLGHEPGVDHRVRGDHELRHAPRILPRHRGEPADRPG